MTYKAYLVFYNLEANAETREDWLYNEWHHGRIYMQDGKFYSTETGKEVKG